MKPSPKTEKAAAEAEAKAEIEAKKAEAEQAEASNIVKIHDDQEEEHHPNIPEDIFPIPANSVGINASAEKIFSVIGEKKKLFMRGTNVTEISTSDGVDYLSPMEPERLCGLIENFGYRVARREARKNKDGTLRMSWRSHTFPISAAKLIMVTDAAREQLPTIRQMANCPIITPEGEIITKGYHDHAGGTYISKGKIPSVVPFDDALTALKGILGDFDFPSESDFSRAFASLISPALKMGGWIDKDFPLDMAEADKSQSGKTFRQKLVCLIYNEVPTSITVSEGGVGSTDEKISGALLKGRPFITLGNIRGKVDSGIMEEALRGSGRVNCRGYRQTGEVDTKPFIWQLSTNGAELTRDLANRTIVTKIRKQPDGYEWMEYPEGDLESHVLKNQEFYLSCVFAILSSWLDAGRPETKEFRHDFREWSRAMDGIVQHCGLAPLLDGHREQQERTANPNLQWLREIALSIPDRDLNSQLTASDLADFGEDNFIDIPGNPRSQEEPYRRVGKVLAKIFRDAGADEIQVDEFVVNRQEIVDYDREGRTSKKYVINRQKH